MDSGLQVVLEGLLLLSHHDPHQRIVGLSMIDDHEIILNCLDDLEDAVVLHALTRLKQCILDTCVDAAALVHNRLTSVITDPCYSVSVRISCIDALKALINAHDVRIPTRGNKRLHDLVFIDICDLAICDFEPDIRRAGFELIADLKQVDNLLLKQAFAKGRIDDLADLVPDSACGLFVHGMEDEYERVRVACMRAMDAHLPRDVLNPLIIDPLIDGFNDDSSTIRLQSVKLLTKIAKQYSIALEEENAEALASLLVDDERVVRTSVHELIAIVRLGSVACLNAIFRWFTRTVLFYPKEHGDLVRLAYNLGITHPLFVCEMIPTWLRLEKYYKPPELRVEDANYLLVLSCIFGAYSVNPNMVGDCLPSHITSKHYWYIRGLYPDVIPSITFP